MTVAGIDVFKEVFLIGDPNARFDQSTVDGQEASPGDVLAGNFRQPFQYPLAERTALNLLQRMCGIATLVRKYVEEIKGTRARILDTRKTMPGLGCWTSMPSGSGGGSITASGSMTVF